MLMPDSRDANQNADLVEVFDTQQESEALVIQGLLDSAGIESVLTPLDAPQDVLPGVGGVVIRVAADMADEAKRVIHEYHNEAGPEILQDEAASDFPE
jgi:hypothetical protein